MFKQLCRGLLQFPYIFKVGSTNERWLRFGCLYWNIHMESYVSIYLTYPTYMNIPSSLRLMIYFHMLIFIYIWYCTTIINNSYVLYSYAFNNISWDSEIWWPDTRRLTFSSSVLFLLIQHLYYINDVYSFRDGKF